MKGLDIVTPARGVLNDPDNLRWDDAEMALWITAGCRYIALRRPDSCQVNAPMTLASGAKQSIAALTPPGVRLLDIFSLRLVDRETLDSHRPGWLTGTPGLPKNYVFDNRDPKTFYVYPPAAAGAVVDGVLYSRNPVVITSGTLNSVALSIDDVFTEPLLNYLLFRCYAKDAAETHNATLAAMYLAACDAALGVKTQADVAASPDTNNPGGKIAAGAMMGGV